MITSPLCAFSMVCLASTAVQGTQELSSPAPEALRPASYPAEIVDLDFRIDGFQSLTFSQWFTFPVGSRLVIRDLAERKSFDSAPEWVQTVYSTPYWLTGGASREGGHELFVAGMKADGSSVIERWRFPRAPNRHFVAYGRPTPAIGAPQPKYCPVVELDGGTFVGGLEDDRLEPPEREVLWEGGGPYTALGADPEGRYVVAFDYGKKSLVRIRWGEDAVPTMETLYSAADHPAFQTVAHVSIRNFDGQRVLFLDDVLPRRSRSSGTFTVITDEQNDGVMDSVETMDHSELYASRYAHWNLWQKLYEPCSG